MRAWTSEGKQSKVMNTTLHLLVLFAGWSAGLSTFVDFFCSVLVTQQETRAQSVHVAVCGDPFNFQKQPVSFL